MIVQEGFIINVTPFTKIVTQRGTEMGRQTVVIEFDEQGQKRRLAFDNYSDAPFTFSMGEMVTVVVAVDASEYNGKWYSRNRCIGMMMSSNPRKKFPLNPEGPYTLKQTAGEAPRQERKVSADDFQY